MGDAIGNFKKTETNQEISLDIFKVWFQGYSKYVKEFDLKKNKDDLMDDVLERILAGEFSTLKEFAESVFKGYYLENQKNAAKFIGLKTNNLAINTTYVVNEFLNEKLGISLDRKISSYEDSYNAMTKIFVDELEKRGQRYLYVDKMISCAKSKFFNFILHEFANRGVDTNDLDRKKFLALPERKEKALSQNPTFYLNQYMKILEDVVRNYSGLKSVFSTYGKTAEIQEFWSVVNDALKVIEENLPEKVKQEKRFVAAKKEVDVFFNETLKNICQKRTREGKFGVYCAEIQEIVKKLKKDEMTAEEGRTLMSFLIKAKDVNAALKITDKNGKNYPLNYFVCMPISPDAYARILADLVRIGKFNPNTLRFLDETKMLVRKSFFMGTHSFSDTEESLELVFKPFRCTIEKDGKYLDASSDEGFAKALNLGKEYIDKYNLPKSKLCYTALAREIFSVDRREPVCLPEKIKSKYLNEKTI